MTTTTSNNRDLIILDRIEQDPEATQASLADQLGVAVGTINWHIKRLISKGYIKVRRIERRKLRYLITPDGLALRAHLTLDYIQTSFQLYRLVRQRVIDSLAEVRQQGYRCVQIEAQGDIADICKLTCLEQNLDVVKDGSAPILKISGLKVFVIWDTADVNTLDLSDLSGEPLG